MGRGYPLARRATLPGVDVAETRYARSGDLNIVQVEF